MPLISLAAFIAALFSFVIFIPICAGKNADSTTPYIVHDEVRSIKPTNQHGTITLMAGVPDWKGVNTDGRIRYIETLLIADSGVSKYYNRDMKKLRRAVITLMQALDLYVYQIGVRMIVVDVIEMSAHNVTLEHFANYRSERFTQLPEHDLAILISSAYEGGIAYVNGICSRSAVGIIGFFADAPMEYASIFFHELAHLLGLSHDASAECSCNNIRIDEGCLKIDGFDNDCSVQALVEKLPDHICIQSPPASMPKNALPVCGNQIVEQHEECDCGPERFCKSLICNPVTCTRTISDLQLLTVLTGITTAISLSVYCIRKWRKPKKQQAFAHANIGVARKVWDTPTFTPLVSSLSDSQAPIWNPSTFSEDSCTFNTPTTSPMKLLDPPLTSTPNRHSFLPPLLPRLATYANISPAKSAENILQAGIPPFVMSIPRTTQTLGRQPRRPAMRHQSQSPLLTHSPLHPPSSTTEPFEAKHTFNCVSRRTVPHSHESNREHSAKMNLASRRLVFSTDSSQEISALSTTSMEHDSPQTLLDECIQLPKTPEKERQHQELIAALSQCLLAEECILNNKICPSSSPARLYPLLPIEQHATVSSASNRLYDTPTSSDQAISLVAAKCDNDSDDHLVKLSFTREPSLRDSSTSKHCRRSRSFVEKPTTSNGVLNVDEKSFEILRNRRLPSSSGHVDNCVTNGRPKVPPPPPPPPPHASEPRPQTEFEAALRATEP